MATKIKNPIKYFDENPIEKQLRDSIEHVKKTTQNELADNVSIAWKQLLGQTRELGNKDIKKAQNQEPMQGELVEGIEIDIFKKEQYVNVEPAINYKAEILRGGEKTLKRENQELRGKIEEIRIELVKLTKTSQELEMSFKEVAVENLPVDPGIYHLNFFEWMLLTIRGARMRIEESDMWLNVTIKKANRKSYWNLSKKHGTSFMLSGERTVATQVG